MSTKDEFKERFCSSIRVQFNWAYFGAQDWPMSEITMTDPDLGSVFTPWYEIEGVPGAGYEQAGASPMSVERAACLLNKFAPELKAAIQQKINALDICDGRIVVPAYQLPDGKYLLLDGNHRLVALAVSKKQRTVVLHVVEGPPLAEVLPDLIHWQKQ